MLQPGDDIGPYRVEAQIGKGGMSRVYRVMDSRDETIWALKELTFEEPELVERFVSEAEMQAAIDHPHMVAARELVQVNLTLGIVMELVDGPSLDRWLYENPDASYESRLDIALQVLEGVGAAHRAGMIHRDLKPGNVLLAPGDGRIHAKVTDFGLAKLRGMPALTRTGVAMGTPRYMAPEQLMDAKHVDARADIYALGALFYELFTGRPAFLYATFAEAYEALKSASYDDPADLGVPPTICRAIRRALEPDREQRVGSCEDLADLLRGRTPRSIRRRRWRMVAVMLLLALGAGAVAVALQPEVLALLPRSP